MQTTLQGVNRWGKDRPRKSKKDLGLSGKGWMYPESCLPKETQKALQQEREDTARQASLAAELAALENSPEYRAGQAIARQMAEASAREAEAR
ncbi:hypothetical protein, partial [Methylococcus sp. S1M]